MKSLSVIYFLVFTCFLVVGYTFSTRFNQPGDALASTSIKVVTTAAHNPIAAMDNGQRNILMISASKLTTDNPKLESIWLATYIPNETTIQLFPVFPSSENPAPYFEQQLEQSFSLYNTGQSLVLNQVFTKILEKNNYWWSGYIVFDEFSLIKIFDLLGGIEIAGGTLPGQQVFHEFAQGLDGSNDLYSSQVTILQSMCRKFTAPDLGSGMDQIARLVPNHILTDLDLSQLKAELDTLASSSHSPTCRFPMLEISRVER